MSNFVRNIVRDLVEKRLWPVAVALIAAVVAVPMLLSGGGSESTPASSAALAPAAPAPQQAAVSLVGDDQTTAVRNRAGKLSNPFKSLLPKVKEAATTSPGTSAATSSGTTTPSTTGSGTSGTGTGGTSPGGTTTPKAPVEPDPIDSYRLTLRFGLSDGKLKTYKDVQRLTPLPNSTSPFFVFLGVLDDKQTAVFLVSARATATGDGACKPSKANCATLHVKKGETVYFDLTVDGKPVQYQMDLVNVKATQTTTDAKTSSAVTAASAVMRDAHVRGSQLFAGADGYRWLPDRDVLVRVSASAARASGKGSAARRSAASRSLPGVAVWSLDRSAATGS